MNTQNIRNGLIAALVLVVSAGTWAAPGNRGFKGKAFDGEGKALQRGQRQDQQQGERRGPKGKRHLHPISFNKLDGNEDGQVTFEEWMDAHDARMEARIKHAEEKGREIPEVTDERLAEREERLTKMFDRISGEKDSFTKEDYREALKKVHHKRHKAQCDKGQGGPEGEAGEDAVIE